MNTMINILGLEKKIDFAIYVKKTEVKIGYYIFS